MSWTIRCMALVLSSGFAVLSSAQSAGEIDIEQLLGEGLAQVQHDQFDIGTINDVFDRDSDTLARSAAINPTRITVFFDTPVAISGSRAYFSHAAGNPAYQWSVEIADSAIDLEAQSGSWWQPINQESAPSDSYSSVDFGETRTASVVRLTVARISGDDFVHINEWELSASNTQSGLIASFPLDNDPGWTTEGLWAFGPPQGNSGDPATASTGLNVYGYNLSGSYENNLSPRALTSTAIDCTGYENVTLEFKRWLGIESSSFDHASVQVSSDAVNWTTVWNHTGGSFQENSWSTQAYDISSVADGQPAVYIRWVMGSTDFSVVYGGWNIDDIIVRGTPLTDLRVSAGTSEPKDYIIGKTYTHIENIYTLSNSSESDLDWQSSTDVAWLDVTPSSGSLPPGGSTVVNVTANGSISGLTVGAHQGYVSFSEVPPSYEITRSIAVFAQRAADIPFAEDFEGGTPLRDVWAVTGTGNYRTQVTSNYGPHAGSHHLTMDSTGGGARNELTLTVDLANYENMVLSYWTRDYNDEATGPPPLPFFGGADFDGIAISADFETWYEFSDLRNISSTYSYFQVSLDDVLAQFGLPEADAYGIRFNQWDNTSLTVDGIALDDIAITGTPLQDLRLSPRNLSRALSVRGELPLPGSYTVIASNAGETAMDWTVSANVSWLDVAPSGGTLNPGESTPITLTFNAQSETLLPGVYSAELTLADDPQSFTVSRMIDLEVADVASWPFVEDFEAGEPLARYWVQRGTGPYRSSVQPSLGPRDSQHLLLDSEEAGVFARNETTLVIDLSTAENVELSFWAKQFGESPHSPPSNPFSYGEDFDGVAVSVDGITWYEVFGLRNLSTEYSRYTVDLDAAFATFGISYTDRVRIRFNQYDDGIAGACCGGIAIDDIVIGAETLDELELTPTEEVYFRGPVGGPFAPLQAVYSPENPENVSIDWSASTNVPWLDIAPTSGTLGALSTDTISVETNGTAMGLSAGRYDGSVEVTNLATGTLRERPVSVYISEIASYPFRETFEGGDPLDSVWTFTGTGLPYGMTSTVFPRPEGVRTYILGSESSGVGSQSDLILAIDLHNVQFAILEFFARAVGNNPDAPPTNPFSGNVNYDGVAISSDGVNWYEVQEFRSLGSQFQEFTIDLDSAFSNAGMSYSDRVQIRFSHYGTGGIGQDSIYLDDIRIGGEFIDDLQLNPRDPLVASGYQRGHFSPKSKLISLSNTGGNPVEWTATADHNWVGATPSGGTIAPGESTEVEVAFTANADLLGPGSYSSTVRFINSATTHERRLPVQLDLQAIPNPTFSSATYQTLLRNGGSQPIRPLHFSTTTPGQIEADGDIRITIPSGFPASFDTSHDNLVLTGSAADKVSALAAFEDGDRTVVIDVVEGFGPGENLIVEGLAFTSPGVEVTPRYLSANFGNGLAVADPKYKQVNRLNNYVTTVDNDNNARTGEPDGDLHVFVGQGNPIESQVEVLTPPPYTDAYILIGTEDIDFPAEQDELFLNGQSLGILTGINNTFGSAYVPIPNPNWVQQGFNDIQIDVSIAESGWVMRVSSIEIVLNGGTSNNIQVASLLTDSTRYSFGESVQVTYDLDSLVSQPVHVSLSMIDPENTMLSISNQVLTVNGVGSGDTQTRSLGLPASGVTGGYKVRMVVTDNATKAVETIQEIEIFVDDHPAVREVVFAPSTVKNDGIDTTTISARVDDPMGPGDIASVAADLSAFGLPSNQMLLDDGTNGDATAGDGYFSFGPFTALAASGVQLVTVTAEDASGLTGQLKGTLTIIDQNSPEVDSVQFSPGVILRDGVSSTDLRAQVSDPQGLGDIVAVRANLSALGQLSTVSLFDDGTGGDVTAGDGIFSRDNITTTAAAGSYNISVTALDTNGFQGTSSGTLTVLESPELAVRDALVPEHASVGSTVPITWNVENTGLTSADALWRDCVYLSEDSDIGNDTELACATRPAPIPVNGTGAAGVDVTIPNVPEGDYWIIIHVDRDDDIPEANHANNVAVAGPISISKPRLVAESLSVPGEAAIGESVPVSWVVRNDGASTVNTSWRDCVYLSADDLVGDDIQLACQDGPEGVAAGADYAGSVSVAIPETAEGTYWIVLNIDEEQNVPEDNRADNFLVQGPITITRADLEVSGITMPEAAAPGEHAIVGWEVANVGTGIAPGSWVDKVYLSPDESIGGDTYVGEVAASNLSMGNSYSREASLALPNVADGSYFVVVIADANQELPETNRANNAAIAGTIQISRPDFTSVLTAIPAQADSGSTVELTWDVSNQGDFRSKHDWADCVYLSSDNTVGNDTLLTCFSRPNDLAVGDAYTQQQAAQLPQVPEGFYWLYVVADGNGEVPETDETNNASALLPITIASPNLVPSALSGPSVASPLQQIEVSWAVENSAIADSSGSWRDAIYLSTDAVAGGDTYLDNFVRPTVLAAGESYNQTKQVTLPDRPEGEYWLVVTADDSDTLLESDETDNSFVFGPFTIARADLKVTIQGSDPASPRSEGPIEISWNVENISVSPTGQNWQDCIYLSDDGEVGDDTIMGCFNRPADLGSGESYSQQKTVILPEVPAGQYWFVVRADGNGAVPEGDEDNNAQIVGPFDVRLVLPPVIEAIDDDILEPGQPYVGPAPVLAQGTAPVSWSLVNGPAGMTIDDATGVVSWPAATEAYLPHVVSVRADNEAGSDVVTWELTVALSYTAYVMTDANIVPAGTPILLSGAATMTGTNEPAPNKAVTVRIRVQDSRRVIEVTSDENGNFDTVFTPLPREGGFYTVGADHPLVPTDNADDAFSIVAFGIEPEVLAPRLTPGETLAVPITLKNYGDEPISGINYGVQGAPAGLTLELGGLPGTIGPREIVPLELRLLGTVDSQQTREVDLQFTSAEGATATLQLNIEVVPLRPQLIANPGHLREGMLVGEQTLVETILTNIGGVETGALDVLLPPSDWVALSTPSPMDSILPGESAGVTLSLTPPADLPLGPYNGYYRVAGAETNLTVPFTLTAVSDGIGDLKITVVDEFTFFDENEPKVAGAEIILSDPYTGAPIEYLDPESGEPAGAFTGPDGSFTFHDLPEGHYEIAVSAEGHDFHRGTYLVPRDGIKEVEVFLSRQLVSYTWNVVPTEIEDRYDITIDLEFETHVPAPVVTVDPPFLDLIDMVEPVKQIDMTISNHGLIAAERVNLSFDADPRYTILPLVEDIGTLPPLSSFVVPVVVYDSAFLAKNLSPMLLRRMSDQQKAALLSGDAGNSQKGNQLPCSIGGRCKSYYRCGSYDVNHEVAIGVRIPTRHCPGNPWTPGRCSDCGGSNSDPGVGRIRRPTFVINNPIPCCNSGCASRGDLVGEATVTANPETACAGEELMFTLDGEITDTGGSTVNQICEETPISGDTVQYRWEITTPYGVEKGGGRVATTFAAEEGVYSCAFFAVADRECAPPPKDLGSAAATVERLVDLQIQGLSEESGQDGNTPNETEPGAFILLNNDLDNVTDPNDLNEDSKFDLDTMGPIEMEDDLYPISIYVRPGAEGTVTLSVPATTKLYEDAKKSAAYEKRSWNVPEESVPTTLWVEGVERGPGEFKLRISSEGTPECEDIVKVTVLEFAVAMDGNWDGEVEFDKPLDRKYEFWVNADRDGLNPYGGFTVDINNVTVGQAPFRDVYDEDTALIPNWADKRINSPRDLEDFARFHVKVDKRADLGNRLGNSIRIALEPDSPFIAANLFWAIDESDDYLWLSDSAKKQAEESFAWDSVNGQLVRWSSSKQGYEDVDLLDQEENYFLLEGRDYGGSDKLSVVVYLNEVEIGRRSVHLDLHPIAHFYDKFRTEGGGSSAYSQENAAAYNPNNNKEYLLYVHGWRMGNESIKEGWTHTIFKRLWWLGYEGHVGLLSWPELQILNLELNSISGTIAELLDLYQDPALINGFNESEFNAYNSAPALEALLSALNSKYDKVTVLAHSQGNIVASEALRLTPETPLVHTYIATQAASPADAYGYDSHAAEAACDDEENPDCRGSVYKDPNVPDVYSNYPPTGQPYFAPIQDAAGSFVNFYNPEDFSLGSYNLNHAVRNAVLVNKTGYWYWDAEGDLQYDPSFGDVFFFGELHKPAEFISIYPLPEQDENGELRIYIFPNDRYRLFSRIAPTWHSALGQVATTDVFSEAWLITEIGLDYPEYHYYHSIQFRQALADVWRYWDKVIEVSEFSRRSKDGETEE